MRCAEAKRLLERQQRVHRRLTPVSEAKVVAPEQRAPRQQVLKSAANLTFEAEPEPARERWTPARHDILLDIDSPLQTQLSRALNVCHAGTPADAFLHNPFALIIVVAHNRCRSSLRQPLRASNQTPPRTDRAFSYSALQQHSDFCVSNALEAPRELISSFFERNTLGLWSESN
jgi:hypothetical protein